MNKEFNNFIKKFLKKKARINDSSDLKNYINSNILYEADLKDLYNLYNLIKKNRTLCVLEFGSGWSTLVIARAMYEIKKKYIKKIKLLRMHKKFELHFVETSKKYAQITLNRIPEYISKEIKIFPTITSCKTKIFNGQACVSYKKIPKINPDFIYVDGPHVLDIKSSSELSFLDYQKCYDFTPMLVDPIYFENHLLPRTKILFDGRTLNARFLKNNFKRNWTVKENKSQDVTLFDLKERYIGPHNYKMLQFKKSK